MVSLKFWQRWGRKSGLTLDELLLSSGGMIGAGGMMMSLERALGLPALLGVILRIGQGVGMVPQLIYRGDATDRERVTDVWQYDLLHRRPSAESTPFTFRADVAGSLAAAGYATIRKFKARGRVLDLTVLDADKVKPKMINGRLRFEDSTGTQTVTRDQSEILYVRGMAVRGQVTGIAPITFARMLFSMGLKRQAFEARHLDNSGKPDLVISFPAGATAEQVELFREVWEATHTNDPGKDAVIGGGAAITTLPVSMEDAQFVESVKMTTEQIAGIYAVPKSFLNLGSANYVTDADWRFFLTFALGWILTATDQAFSADEDLFPAGSGLFCESIPEALLKQDPKTRYDAYRIARQGGWISANTIRAWENLPPVDGGDEIQQTPVGGAPNPALAKFAEDDLLGELLARMRDSREKQGEGEPAPAT